MDDAKPERRFQFSLRKLLLWMAVLAVYLCVLRLISVSPLFAVITTVWLAVFLVLRLKWRGLKGANLATFGTGFGSAVGLGVVHCLSWCLAAGKTSTLPVLLHTVFISMVASVVLGCFAGLGTFLVVDIVVRVADWFDALLQTKAPQATDEHDRQTPSPGAVSSEK